MASDALNIPHGMTLEQVLGYGDGPLDVSIASVERLYQTKDETAVRRAVAFIGPQHVCDNIIKHHGAVALSRILTGIARAASKLKVPMNARVRTRAEVLGLEVF